jgi:arylsulfatase A-like enzyme
MNVLLVAVDCLRADRLPNLGRGPVTPNLQRLADRGTIFTQAVTACVTTSPSFASLLTGRFPPRHRVFSLHGSRLAADCPSLIEEVARAGYYTFAEVTGPLLELIGLNRGFTRYQCRGKSDYLDGRWGEQLLAELKSRTLPEPWFGLVHLWELHGPQHVPPEFDHRAHGRSAYDRALAALDQPLGRLLDAVPDDTLILLFGDHGESLSVHDLRLQSRVTRALYNRLGQLWEPVATAVNGEAAAAGLTTRLLRGLMRPWKPSSRYQFYRHWRCGHGWHLYDELVRVPLVIAGPRISVRRVSEQVRTVDMLPTVLDWAGVAVSQSGPPLDGRSMRPLIEGKADEPRPAYLEAAGSCLPDRIFWLRGMRTSAYKYIYTPFADHRVEELYDLAHDPAETRSVLDERPEIVAKLRADCEAIARQEHVEPAPEEPMSAEDEAMLEERLRQLGYIE